MEDRVGLGKTLGRKGVIIVSHGNSWLICDPYHTDFLVNMSASADVLAQAKVEVGLGAIPEGKNVRSNKTTIPHSSPVYWWLTRIMEYRSSSSGVESPCSSVTVPRMKSTRPTRSKFPPSVTPRPMRSVFRTPSGLSCLVCE